jgi:hypothetical protein
MKYKFLKLSSFLTAVFLIFIIGSCVKSAKDFTDLSQVNDLVILNNSGLANFKASNIQVNTTLTTTLTKTITVELASVEASSSPVTVTLGVEDAKRTAYNSANSTNYQAFASNQYKIVNTSVTIDAGKHYATTTLEIYQNMFDPAVSYLLPVSITDASGKGLTSNQNTLYFNIIGNPLAGQYNVVGTRYNYTGSIGYACGSPIPAGYGSTATSPSPKTASPVDSKVIAIDYANLGGSGYQYLLSVDPTNPNNAIVSSNSTLAGALIVTYCVHTYNAATKTFHVLSTYNNGAGGVGGSDRIIDEVFTHQ